MWMTPIFFIIPLIKRLLKNAWLWWTLLYQLLFWSSLAVVCPNIRILKDMPLNLQDPEEVSLERTQTLPWTWHRFPQLFEAWKVYTWSCLKNLDPTCSMMNLIRTTQTFESWKVAPDYQGLEKFVKMREPIHTMLWYYLIKECPFERFSLDWTVL